MSEIKLKPCPFCGGKAEIFRWQAHINDEYHSDLVCTNCGAGFHNVSSEKAAFKAWNKRFDNAVLVHAHWKGYHTQDPYCSNCGFTYDREQGEDAQITDYCGNCGAKMDENEVENLKRCSCGDRYYRPEIEKDENGKWFIRCHMCHKIVWGNTIEEAVNAWNEGAKADDEATP